MTAPGAQPEIDEIEQLLDSADLSNLDSDGSQDSAEIEAIGQTVEQLLESLGDETPLEDEAILDEVQPAAPEPLATEQPASDLAQSNTDEFPVFDEETLLAELEMEPELDAEHPQPDAEPVQEQDNGAPLTLDDLPEFDEEAAFNDPEVEQQAEQEKVLTEDDEQAMLDNIVRQLQQAAEAAEKPPVQPEVAPEITPEPQAPQQEQEFAAQSSSPYSLHGRPDIEFETLDAASLPEFSEDDALQASFDEQHELEQYEMEQGSKTFRATAASEHPDTQPTNSGTGGRSPVKR